MYRKPIHDSKERFSEAVRKIAELKNNGNTTTEITEKLSWKLKKRYPRSLLELKKMIKIDDLG